MQTTKTTLHPWAAVIIDVIKTVPGTQAIVQGLMSPGEEWVPLNQPNADRIQYALDDAGYNIELLDDHMMISKIEGKAIAIDWSDGIVIGFVDADML